MKQIRSQFIYSLLSKLLILKILFTLNGQMCEEKKRKSLLRLTLFKVYKSKLVGILKKEED